ncbi:MAG: haloacid dehalogenase, partial [Hyphomicrobiales bacterium]
SKNEDANARLPFNQHPDMLLREADIAVFQANWSGKPANLEAIAGALEIGLDSLVFLDDNGAERAQVRAALPMVAVPELPDDPAFYPLYLSSAGYFEALSFSDEDRKRIDTYTTNARRAEIRERAIDLGDYLRTLNMTIDIRPFDDLGRQRIVQLINKSNQFNLTTRRYTEAQVAAVSQEPSIATLQVRLKDRFSDFGMIGVYIARPYGDHDSAWEVDTWLMSCRVLGRKVEDAMLNALVDAAGRAGISTIYARYLRTAKNMMVADLFDRLGFEQIEANENGDRHYRLAVAGYVKKPVPHASADIS